MNSADTRTEKLADLINEHEADLADFADLVEEFRKAQASTAEAFTEFSRQIRTFETAVLHDYQALLSRIETRLERLGGVPSIVQPAPTPRLAVEGRRLNGPESEIET